MGMILGTNDALYIRDAVKVEVINHVLIEDPDMLPFADDQDKITAFDAMARGEEYPVDMIDALYVQGRIVLWIRRTTCEDERKEWFYDSATGRWMPWESVDDSGITYITNRRGRIIDEVKV